MPASEYLLKDKERITERISNNKIKYMLFVAGMYALIHNVFFNEYYNAEALTPVTLVLQGTPSLNSKGNPTGYRLYTYNQNATFLISDGALDIIKNKKAENIIQTLHAGDTVNIQIKASDEAFIKAQGRKINVIGCEVRGQALFSPDQVQQKDKNSWWLNMSIAGGLILIAVIMQTVQFVRWINSPDNRDTTENSLPTSSVKE